ncbi:MAG: hypothetical protein CM15mP98_06450 [Paracoccaceae bacterium]|nr:MAG: hypothetical protein CM15mP98_06450 [Paracoccaceae bacterium]
MISFVKNTSIDKDLRDSYHLLGLRTKSISHSSMPSFQEHKEFVQKHPYRYWFFVKLLKESIGTLYLLNVNSIGINLIDEYKDMTEKVLLKVQNFRTTSPIKSVRSRPYYKLPQTKHQLADTIKRLGGNEIQKTFTLP